MAKTLIATILLCIAVATFATSTTTPPTPTSASTETPPTGSPPTGSTSTGSTSTGSTSTGSTSTGSTSTGSTSTGSTSTGSTSTGSTSTGSTSTGSTSTGSTSTGSTSTGSTSTGSTSTGSTSTGSTSTGSPPTGSTSTGSTSTGSTSTGSTSTEGSSVSPNTGSSQTNAPSTAPVPATTKPPGPCASNPCHGGSTCEDRADQSFACLCLAGEVYNSPFCLRAKVFPGLLVLTREYDDEMADKTSQIFKQAAESITDAIDNKFSGVTNGYFKSIVLELREQKSKTRAQKQSRNVEASIEIIYESTAEITQETVTKTMEEVACETCPLEGNFQAKTLCDSNSCDASSTTCSSTDGSFQCSCKVGYINPDYSDRLCLACPSGEKVENNKCKSCGFGYGGFNCEDNRLLIVVIVCSILGVLLIAMLIALPLVVTKSKKKSSKGKVEDIGKPYQSHSIAKAPLSQSNGNGNNFSASAKEPTNSLANSGAPRIPRATTNSNWDSRTNLEMTSSNSQQNLIPSGMNSRFNNNQDDTYSFPQNKPRNHPYEEIQPKSNPYSQNRASNPYAQIRGQTNPYYN